MSASSATSQAPTAAALADDTNEEDADAKMWFDEFDTRAGQGEEQQKDMTAESLYRLIGEVFDMRGVFRLLRKSLMTFVQITYGSTINRQIR